MAAAQLADAAQGGVAGGVSWTHAAASADPAAAGTDRPMPAQPLRREAGRGALPTRVRAADAPRWRPMGPGQRALGDRAATDRSAGANLRRATDPLFRQAGIDLDGDRQR